MTKPRRVRITQERHFAAHHMLLRAASPALDAAKTQSPGWFNQALIVITLSALAMEALSNAVGARVVKDWPDFESLSPYGKLRFLAEHLGAPYSPETPPWPTLRWLYKFRNAVAHPKPEDITHEKSVPEHAHEAETRDAPQSKLERQVTVVNAINAFEAVHAVKGLLCEKLTPEQRFGLYADGWLTSIDLEQ